MTREVQAGDLVRMHYVTRSLEGCTIEASGTREPIEFVAGGADVIRGVSQGVIGMKVGETQVLTVAPEDAFGRQRSDLKLNIPRGELPEGVAAGDQLSAFKGDDAIDVWVQRITEREVLVDANHPLAGETLVVEVNIVDCQVQNSNA